MLALASFFHHLTTQEKIQKRFPPLHTERKRKSIQTLLQAFWQTYQLHHFNIELTCWPLTESCGCPFSSGNTLSIVSLSFDTDGATAAESERRKRNYYLKL